MEPSGSDRSGDRRKSILLAAPLPPPVGGMATWTQALLQSSLAAEFRFDVVNLSRGDANVEGRSRFRFDRAASALRILGQIVAALATFRVDLVHINTPYQWAMVRDGLVIWLAWMFRVPTLLHIHGGSFPEFAAGLPRPIRLVLRTTLRRVTRLVAITRETQVFLETHVRGDGVVYLPNFVHVPAGPPRRRERSCSSPIRFLFVGWMIRAKGVEELLEAASSIKDAEFVLVGPFSEDYEAELRDRIRAAGEHVRLLGPRDHAEVMQLYAEADVFVLPSHREGFPMVILEAMAAGLPVVATKVGAITDAVRDGIDGFLIDAKDGKALAERLGRFVRDPELCATLGANAFSRVRENFDREIVTESLRSLYRELM